MYIARRFLNGRLHYFISESYQEGPWWKSRDLLALGTNPGRFVIYTERSGFYIHESVETGLREAGVSPGMTELEQLFWPFLRREARQFYEDFHTRTAMRRRHLGYDEQKRLEAQILPFDRRRLLYLKNGQVDLSGIASLPIRYFLPLSDKSRDEIEQYFLMHEMRLRPGEYKKYVYAAFNLQRFFANRQAREWPQILDQQQLDQRFEEELCSLNASEEFWMGEAPPRLHPYLVRYAIMYFDYGFEARSLWDEFIREFMSSRRRYQPPAARTTLSEKEADELFGHSREELKAMSKTQLKRLFKRQAHQLHPDKGGEHEKFIKLTEAYEVLNRERKRSSGKSSDK